MVAEAAASIPLLLYDGMAELDDHPLLALLAKPNPHQGGADLLEALYGHLLVSETPMPKPVRWTARCASSMRFAPTG